MRIISVPPSLDDKTLDLLAQGIGEWPPTEGLLFDARGSQWASPYGLTAMLSLGQAITEARLPTPRFTVPEKEEVRSYWSRAGFFHAAAECFELVGKVPKRTSDPPSDVLLPVTPIRAAEDVHHVVGRIQRMPNVCTQEQRWISNPQSRGRSARKARPSNRALNERAVNTLRPPGQASTSRRRSLLGTMPPRGARSCDSPPGELPGQ